MGGRGGFGGTSTGVGVALAVLVAVLLIGLGEWIRGRAAGSTEPAPRPDLRAWGMLGCWDVRVEPWILEAWGGARPGALGGEVGDGARSPGTSGSAPAGLAPPERVMLLPGAVDRWGRRLPSRRAVALPESAQSSRRLRWFVRADTLWIVWSEGTARAGVALFADGDSLAGMARGVDRADSLDGSAPARAWRVNCATGLRERDRDRPRP